MEPIDPTTATRIIPVIAEALQVSKQVVETGHVLLTKTVYQQEETVTIPLTSEEYLVERVTINQYVDELPAPRQEGDTTIYPVLKEVLVVEKRLLLVEEVRVRKQQIQTAESQTVLLRREEVRIERNELPTERPV